MSAVLGLTDKGDFDWARLRGLQYAALAKLTFYRAFAHALLGVFVAQIYLPTVGLAWIGAWLGGIALVHIRAAIVDRRLLKANRQKITGSDVFAYTTTAILSGILWASAITFFAPTGSLSDAFALMIIAMILMAGSVYFYTTSPLSIMALGRNDRFRGHRPLRHDWSLAGCWRHWPVHDSHHARFD